MSYPKPVLIRIDDVGIYDPQRDRIIYALCEAGVRITCAVVPTWLMPECTEFLLQTANRFPGYLEVHQHGYCHQNYGDSSSDHKYEFGLTRSLKQQRLDIAQGYEILHKSFGSLFFPAFTPPYGGYDDNTLTVLSELCFLSFSTYADDEPNGILPEFSPDIDCFTWNPIQLRPWKEITSAWCKESNTSIRGFILHPRLMMPESVVQFSANLPVLLAKCTTMTFAQLLQTSSRMKSTIECLSA